MKITKRHLRRIIKEEKRKVLVEQLTVAHEGELLAELSIITGQVAALAKETYGLTAPGESPDAGQTLGDQIGTDLDVQVEKLNIFFDKLEEYFESVDDLAGRNPGGSIG